MKKSAVLALLVILAACSANEWKPQAQKQNQEYLAAKGLISKGQVEEGIEKIRQLSAADPENIEYRSYLKHQQDLQLAILLRQGDLKREQRQWNEAEAIYNRVLDMDGQNQRALDGMQALTTQHRHETMMKTAQENFLNNDLAGAQSIARAVLAEESTNQSARTLYEEIEQQRSNKITSAPQLKSVFKKPITLEFKDVPVKSVFEFISKATNINFIYDHELNAQQPISIFVRNTSIEDAIEVLLTSNQLSKKILNDNTLLIYPLSRSQEYQEMYVRSFYLGNTDAKKIMAMIKTVLKTKDVYIDEKLNTLVMRDTPEAIRNAEKLITSQDIADPEVVLEVEVLEVNRRSLEALGIRYPSQVAVGVQGRTDVNGTTILTPGELTIRELKNFNSELGVFSISDPVLALNLLQQDTDTNLLANPHIRVKNREKAKIHVGDRIPILTSIANATGFVSQTVSYIEVGVKLDVEPTILLNDEVSIKVGLEVSNQTDQLTSSTGTVTYTIGTRNANTILRLKNGETQVLAGLFRNDDQRITNKVPGLGSLPFIGRLFNDKNNDRRKKEIALLITPRIISNITPVNAVYTSFPAGVDRNSSGSKTAATSRPANDYSANQGYQAAPPERADKAISSGELRPIDEISNPRNTDNTSQQ